MSMNYCLMNNCDDSTHLSIISLIARSENRDNMNIGALNRKNFSSSALPLMQRVIMNTPDNEGRLRGYDMFGNDAEVFP